MDTKQIARSAAKWSAAMAGIACGCYATYAGLTWLRYGNQQRATDDGADPLLDLFMPVYEVADRHHVYIEAPADVALTAAAEIEVENNAFVRGIFKTREWILHAKPETAIRPRGFLADMKSLGWGILAELPGREIIAGAVTKPWEPNPIFRPLAPDEFAAFNEPGYVKIAWTLRTNTFGHDDCIFRTETRAVATDAEARKRFRRYWSLLSPGIIAVRRVLLPVVKAEAERRWRSPLAA
jgi:hypothetical protein